MTRRLRKNSGNDQTIIELAAIFHGDDEAEVAFPEKLAKALNETMRNVPEDDKAKTFWPQRQNVQETAQTPKRQI